MNGRLVSEGHRREQAYHNGALRIEHTHVNGKGSAVTRVKVIVGGVSDDVFMQLPEEYRKGVEAIRVERTLEQLGAFANPDDSLPSEIRSAMSKVRLFRDQFDEPRSPDVAEYVEELLTVRTRLHAVMQSPSRVPRFLGKLNRKVLLPISLEPAIDELVHVFLPEGMERFRVKLATEELLLNAKRHGDSCDLRDRTQAESSMRGSRFLLHVQNQGAGYNPDSVPNFVAPENINSASGRGMGLIREYADRFDVLDEGRLAIFERETQQE